MSKKTEANKKNENKMQDNKSQGDLVFPKGWMAAYGPTGPDTTENSGSPTEWTLFGPVGKDDPEPDFAGMNAVPAAMTIAGKRLPAQKATFRGGYLDLGALLDGKAVGKTAYLLATVEAAKDLEFELGAGADWWMKWWVNGAVVCDTLVTGNNAHPPSVLDHRFKARLKAGRNLLAVKVVSGNGSFMLAAGGSGAMAAQAEAQAELDGILSVSDPARARQWVARHCGTPRRVLFDSGHRLDLATCTTVGETIAWLHAEITADKAVDAVMGAGAGGELLVLVNGKKVFHLPPQPKMGYLHRPESSILDHSFAVHLHAGANRIDVMARTNTTKQQFDLALGGPQEVETLKQERRRRWTAMLDKRDAAPAGAIVYVNPNPPEVPLAPYSGERYRDRVPDTYDVAERAALCLNALTGATNPLADHELYFWAKFFRNPAVMQHEISDLCHTKFMEALPLLRIASGSRVRLEVDEVWRQVTLKSIGPDGLFYVPLTGRPWGREPAAWVARVARADGTLVPSSDPSVAQFSYAVVCGRMMNAMITHHLREGHPFWMNSIAQMVGRLAELAIDQGDYCFLPPIAVEPSARYDHEAMAAQRPAPTLPEGEFFVRLLEGLGMFHRLTGHDGARELGGKLIRFIREQWPYFTAKGEFHNGGMHFHGHTLVLLNLLEMATATDDRHTVEFVRRSYEWAKTPAAGSSDTIGFFPELAHPAFGTCEACEIADMIGLALKLSRAGVGDYWNDAERWTRNHFAESQLLDEQVPLVYYLSGAQPQTPVGEYETAWHVAERNVGAFAGWSTANDWATTAPGSIMHCCTGNAARTLYWIWREALRFQDGELRVNLLLNRASREADVYSFIPYQGKVEIKVKAACKAVCVHAPGWVKDGSPEMTAAVDGKAVKTRWEGRYLVLGPAQPGQCVTVEFPIAERTIKETVGGAEYTLVIKGDTVVHIDPPGKNLPLYRRDHYRQSEPRYVEVERFLSDTVVEY